MSIVTTASASASTFASRKVVLTSEPKYASWGPGKRVSWDLRSARGIHPSTPCRRDFGARSSAGIWAPMTDGALSGGSATRPAAVKSRLLGCTCFYTQSQSRIHRAKVRCSIVHWPRPSGSEASLSAWRILYLSCRMPRRSASSTHCAWISKSRTASSSVEMRSERGQNLLLDLTTAEPLSAFNP